MTKWPRYYTIIVLCLITCLAALLRFYNLTNLPAILNRDEAALAYNAYLLHTTGVDEWQTQWPLVLESFGDTKLLGYPLLLSGLFTILPINDWTVRLPAALAGTFLPVAIYLLIKSWRGSDRWAMWAAGIAAVTPVFIYFSRMAFEANLALLFWTLGLAGFFAPWQKWGILLSSLLILLAIFTYNTPLILLPLVIPIILLWQKNLRLRYLVILGSILLFSLLVLRSAIQQKAGISIFSDGHIAAFYPEFRASWPSYLQWLLGNKYAYYLHHLLIRFLQSFGWKFLVIRGGEHPWHALPGWAHITWPSLIAFYLGLVLILKKVINQIWIATKKNKYKIDIYQWPWLVIYLLPTSLAPAVITVDAPHATRSLWFFILLICVASWGIASISQTLEKNVQRLMQIDSQNANIIISLLLTTLLVTPTVFYLQTLVNFPAEQANTLKVGLPTFLQEIKTNIPHTEQVLWLDRSGYDYILIAWYWRIEPQDFFTTIHRQQPDRIGFYYVDELMNISFRAQESDRLQEKYLVQWQNNQWQLTNL